MKRYFNLKSLSKPILFGITAWCLTVQNLFGQCSTESAETGISTGVWIFIGLGIGVVLFVGIFSYRIYRREKDINKLLDDFEKEDPILENEPNPFKD